MRYLSLVFLLFVSCASEKKTVAGEIPAPSTCAQKEWDIIMAFEKQWPDVRVGLAEICFNPPNRKIMQMCGDFYNECGYDY